MKYLPALIGFGLIFLSLLEVTVVTTGVWLVGVALAFICLSRIAQAADYHKDQMMLLRRIQEILDQKYD